MGVGNMRERLRTLQFEIDILLGQGDTAGCQRPVFQTKAGIPGDTSMVQGKFVQTSGAAIVEAILGNNCQKDSYSAIPSPQDCKPAERHSTYENENSAATLPFHEIDRAKLIEKIGWFRSAIKRLLIDFAYHQSKADALFETACADKEKQICWTSKDAYTKYR